MLSRASSSCAKHLVSKAEENPLLEDWLRFIKPICKGNRIRSLDFFANFLDQAKKWKEKEKRKNYVHFVGLVSVGL
jgi:hypothetical protein